jgi:hypothetical protein
MNLVTLLHGRGTLRAAGATILFVAAAASLTTAAGKPGYPDKIVWNGVTWAVKTSRSAVGPGPNLFEKANASVDSQGRLHLRIASNASGAWSCAEIIAPASYGYGTYTFDLASPVDAFNPNVVLGLFTWSDRAPYAHREIDIEFARWGNAADPTNAQYVVQPYDLPLHLKRFTTPSATTSTHRFTWRPGTITWESFDANGGLIDSYVYTGSDVPRSGDERVHLNLWLFNGAAPTDGLPVDVVVSSFTFAP